MCSFHLQLGIIWLVWATRRHVVRISSLWGLGVKGDSYEKAKNPWSRSTLVFFFFSGLVYFYSLFVLISPSEGVHGSLPSPPPGYVTEDASVFVRTGQQLRLTQVWHSARVGAGLQAALIKSRLD